MEELLDALATLENEVQLIELRLPVEEHDFQQAVETGDRAKVEKAHAELSRYRKALADDLEAFASFAKQHGTACTSAIELAVSLTGTSATSPKPETLVHGTRCEIESLAVVLRNGSPVRPESVTGDDTKPVAMGVSVFDAAVHFEDGDQAAATNLVKRWSDSRTPKPSNLGNDPEDGRRKLSELSEILNYVGEVSGGLMPGEKRELRNHLRTRLRKPR